MNKTTCIIFSAMMLLCLSCSDRGEILLKGVDNPNISLNGVWKVISGDYERFIKAESDTIRWREINVPGEAMMQGFPIKHNQPFLYTRNILIPSDYSDKVIKIRFDGVYSYARVWVNGNFIRDHSGGFTAWDCDITSVVEPGKQASIYVEVTDRADEISYASGYAKHPIGGILRNVSLHASPEYCPEDIIITTDLDDQYKDALLTVRGVTRFKGDGVVIKLELFDIENRKVGLEKQKVALTGNEFEIKNSIINPLKWDAEHPNLYRLRINLIENGKLAFRKEYMIGFREIEIDGNMFLVNGKQIRLRGACRHDIHPLLGRLSTPEYDLLDVQLAKEANINFIRTSHYPPSENFLELCDKFGIYVEDETAVCFVGSHRTAEYYPGSSESSEDYNERYLSQLEEMVNNHRNHPSVIIWSIGNENTFGTNFKESYDWVKEADPTRPVIFSYPGQVPDSITSYDIISMHYPGTDGSMEQYGIKTNSFGNERMPVIFDEWAHVPCYNNETVREDPNVRDFWGISLDTMWQKVYDSEGGLGGAIWGMIDETFMLPEDLPGYNQWWGKLDKNVIPGEFTGPTIGYGEWGFVDSWRRKKPEFWSVKKAYSPVRVMKTKGYNFKSNSQVEIPVYNRFDFTNLNELTLKLIIDGKSYTRVIEDIPPHSKGIINLLLEERPSNDIVGLDFIDVNGMLIDSYILSENLEADTMYDNNASGSIELTEESGEYVVICGNNMKIHLDKSTGLFTMIENSSGLMNVSGPFINMRALGKEVIYSSFLFDDLCSEWRLKSLNVRKKGNAILASIKGTYTGGLDVTFDVKVDPDSKIRIGYVLNNIHAEYIRETGIKFIFDNIFDTLYWERSPYWSSYPEGHLSAATGNVPLYTDNNNSYREKPDKDWQYDKKSFFYDGTGKETSGQLINIARSTKENILSYSLGVKTGGRVLVHGEGRKSCRIQKSGEQIDLIISDMIDYPDISWGNYSRNIFLRASYSGNAILTFN